MPKRYVFPGKTNDFPFKNIGKTLFSCLLLSKPIPGAASEKQQQRTEKRGKELVLGGPLPFHATGQHSKEGEIGHRQNLTQEKRAKYQKCTPIPALRGTRKTYSRTAVLLRGNGLCGNCSEERGRKRPSIGGKGGSWKKGWKRRRRRRRRRRRKRRGL